MTEIGNMVVDKKVAKRSKIDGKSYFVVSVPKAKAVEADRFCADVPAGWLVKWNGGYLGDDGGPGRTLCTQVGPLTWVDGVTYHALETRSEAAEIDLGQGFTYDIGPGVPPEEVTLIKTGFWIAQSYINRFYGGAIVADYAKGVVVKIEADKEGAHGCCSGIAEYGARPYFNVRDPNWAQNVNGRGWSSSTDKMKSVIDEYVHGWHASLGALSLHVQPLGNWMNSGIAEYIAYSALVEAGKIKQKDADRMEFTAAVGAELDPTLQSLQSVETPVWPGHVGYVAIKWLVDASPNAQMSLRILATSIGSDHMSVDDAFYTAFGVTLADFYPQFEAWKKAIRKNPVKAASHMPKLVLSSAPPAATEVAAAPTAAAPEAEPTADQLFRKGFQADVGADGVAQNDVEAVKWYTLAAAKSQHEAERNLAGMYGSGRGVKQDDAEARRLFEAAANGGDASAQYALGEWYSSARDDKIKWFRMAAKQGYGDAIEALKKLGATVE